MNVHVTTGTELVTRAILDWLGANLRDKDLRKTIENDLAFLPTGTAWVCSAKDNFFERVTFPRIKTFDNSATPDNDAEDFDVATAHVDHDELRAIIGDAVKEAEANDPKALKAEIARLNRKLADQTTKVEIAPAADVEAIRKHAYLEGYQHGIRQAQDNIRQALGTAGDAILHAVDDAREILVAADSIVKLQLAELAKKLPENITENITAPPKASVSRETPSQSKSFTQGVKQANGIPGPQQRILDSLMTWAQMGHPQPSNAQVAWLARYSPRSSSYTNPRGGLKSADLLDYPSPDKLALTGEGKRHASALEIRGTLLDYVLLQLPGPERRILAAIAHAYPKAVSNEHAADDANYSATSSSYTNPRGSLKTKYLVTYPNGGMVRAADWLFA